MNPKNSNFVLPTIGNAKMSSKEQLDLIAAQATPEVLNSYLEYAKTMYEKIPPKPSANSDGLRDNFVFESGELVNLVKAIKEALKN